MTREEIEQAKPGDVVRDNGERSVKGLHVRAFPLKKCFYLYYCTRAGVERKPKLGEYPTLSIDQARKIAREILSEVSAGKDPGAEWKEKRAEQTVGELFSEVWKSHWEPMATRWAKEVKGNWERNLLPYFASKKLSEVTAPLIREWLLRYKEKPYAGNRSLEVLSKLFNYAEEMGDRTQHTNPCAIVKALPEVSRDRYAKEDEIMRLGAILKRETEAHPREVAFLYLLIFSGSRPSAIERATPLDLELKTIEGQTFGVLTIEGKTGIEKVHLPPQAMHALSLIPGPTLTGIKMPRTFWNRIRAEAGCPDLWARDWRRTFATYAMGEGFSSNQVGELLNHKSAQTTKIYAKLADTARLEAASQTAYKLEKLLQGRVS